MLSFAGDITIPGGMTLTVDSDLNGASPHFTLTCISTGGPATTVTWTRDFVTATGDEMTTEVLNDGETYSQMTVVDDGETAQYTHTLNVADVTGALAGIYKCNVSNNKPSSAVAQFSVEYKVYVSHVHICSPLSQYSAQRHNVTCSSL